MQKIGKITVIALQLFGLFSIGNGTYNWVSQRNAAKQKEIDQNSTECVFIINSMQPRVCYDFSFESHTHLDIFYFKDDQYMSFPVEVLDSCPIYVNEKYVNNWQIKCKMYKGEAIEVLGIYVQDTAAADWIKCRM